MDDNVDWNMVIQPVIGVVALLVVRTISLDNCASGLVPDCLRQACIHSPVG